MQTVRKSQKSQDTSTGREISQPWLHWESLSFRYRPGIPTWDQREPPDSGLIAARSPPRGAAARSFPPAGAAPSGRDALPERRRSAGGASEARPWGDPGRSPLARPPLGRPRPPPKLPPPPRRLPPRPPRPRPWPRAADPGALRPWGLPAPARGGAKANSSQPRPAASRGARGDAGDQQSASPRGCSATQKKPPDAKGAAGAGRATPRPQKKQEASVAAGRFLPPLESRDIPRVEEETRGQWSNPKWYQWRENRITASVAPRIANSKFANGRTEEVPQSYLSAVVSSGPRVQTPAMSWGVRNEKAAVRAYEQLKSRAVGKEVQVDDCGLFIHREKEWIAASPDGVVKEAATGKALGLLEVKCPYKHRNRTVREACKDKDFCLEVDGDSYALKKDHAYFTQVQCQLAAAGFQQADFVVHTTKETAVVPVEFDAKFWGQTVPKLEKFYTEAVIPHLEEKAASSARAKEE
ncbi:uncharacterized protein [Numenius arquata]|uniref:uncharacterized protein n=1 Tax=Numenius arquata TaxID=31919 RepID=UPI003D3058EC